MAETFGESKPPGAVMPEWTYSFLRRAAAAAVFLLLASCAASTPAPAASGRAGLIVGLSDGSFSTTCVTLGRTDFSGEDLLRGSGLPVTLDAGNALGTLVCSIAEEGCRFPVEACLCRCRGVGPCSYWAYFTWEDEDGWTYAVQGARLRRLQDGDLDAWIWLDRSLPGDELPLPPSDLTFDAVCG